MKSKNEILEKLNKISKKNQNWIAEEEEWQKNFDWIKVSHQIAFRILELLDQKGISQKELAERMGVSPQQISKIVKGNENLTLETIVKLEKCLGAKLIEVCTEAKPVIA
ncbi:helix-turn-helix transcriptional regulator [Raineya sp.]|jgi:addiction module HigA family antidote